MPAVAPFAPRACHVCRLSARPVRPHPRVDAARAPNHCVAIGLALALRAAGMFDAADFVEAKAQAILGARDQFVAVQDLLRGAGLAWHKGPRVVVNSLPPPAPPPARRRGLLLR